MVHQHIFYMAYEETKQSICAFYLHHCKSACQLCYLTLLNSPNHHRNFSANGSKQSCRAMMPVLGEEDRDTKAFFAGECVLIVSTYRYHKCTTLALKTCSDEQLLEKFLLTFSKNCFLPGTISITEKEKQRNGRVVLDECLESETKPILPNTQQEICITPETSFVTAETIDCEAIRTENFPVYIHDAGRAKLLSYLKQLGTLYIKFVLLLLGFLKLVFPTLKFKLQTSDEQRLTTYNQRFYSAVTEQRTFEEIDNGGKLGAPVPASSCKAATQREQATSSIGAETATLSSQASRIAIHKHQIAPGTQSDPLQSGNNFRPEDLRREIYRLTTFQLFPQNVRINPSQYAKAGFYYVGSGDLVKCFACGNTLSNLTFDIDPFLLRYHASHCRFARQTDDCGNVAFNIQSSRVARNSLNPPSSQHRSGDEPHGRSLSSSQANVSRVEARSNPPLEYSSGRSTPSQSPYQTAHPVSPPSASASNYPPFAPPPYEAPGQSQFPIQRQLATISDPAHERLVRGLSLNREADRIKTFTSLWSRTELPSPRSMAQAGWFYLGNLDRTQCFVCGQVLRNWRRSDDPRQEHLRHFQHCPFLQGREVGNVPESTQAPAPVRRGNMSEQQRIDLRDMFPCSQPAHPQMRSLQARAATFRNWPYTRATPHMLAEAGLYSLGDRDRVKCFYCNGGLQNWRLNDDPWEEHAKWYPTCEFVLQNQGPEYIHSVVSRFPDLDRPTMSAPGRNNTSDPQPRQVQSGPEWIDDPAPQENPNAKAELLTEAMQSDVAITVIGMGFEESTVKKLMQQNIEERGAAYQSASALLDAVMDYQSVQEMEEETTPQVPTQESTAPRASSSREAQVVSPAPRSYESRGSEARRPEYSPSLTSGIQESLSPYENEPRDEPQYSSLFGNSLSASNHALLRPLSPASGSAEPSLDRHYSGPPQAFPHLDQPSSSRSTSMPEPRETRKKQNPAELKRQLEQLQDQKLCKVCLDRTADVVFIPCGHICCCMECTRALRSCPICRIRIEKAVRTYTH